MPNPDAAAPAGARALTGELAEPGRYGRRPAAFGAVLTGRADLLGGRPTDPDRVVRGRAIDALRTVPELGRAVPDAYLRAPYAVRRELREALVRGRHAELVAARLLPARAHDGFGHLLAADAERATARLAALREHAGPEVRDAARAVVVAPECPRVTPTGGARERHRRTTLTNGVHERHRRATPRQVNHRRAGLTDRHERVTFRSLR
ncbi:hypothetical protein HUT16_08075 [Kitasatospora sp. NA04385]|uniref:hypothetical protein n=1 Tax=Kitasatospora sp. NA04385 TaxID=2742135 RepID=UPI00158FCFDB|nr:hypothetical protein [Kitasatospora sp. NA04385]QKW19028.1 hypothetical protein HUT16_08075 [Kitasatospora sp. NA04385]